MTLALYAIATDEGKTVKVTTEQVDSISTQVIDNNTIPEGESDWGWIATIAVLILETIARVYPTKRNISIISLVVRLINIIIPNLKKKQKSQDKRRFEN